MVDTTKLPDGTLLYRETLTPGDDMYDGDGAATDEYNNTDGDANGTSYLKADMADVDIAQVTVRVNDPALSTSAVGVQVSDARPATPSDFQAAEDYVSGAILFTLVDEDGSGEIADDTDISGTLEFDVTAHST